MSSQIQVPKLVQNVLVGPPSGNVAVPKLVMYVFAFPGEGTTATGQGHVYSQIIRKV